MKKKRLSKILSTLCAIATMTLCFSNVQAATVESTESIDQSKSYIIYSGDTKKTLYDDGGANEGWLRQGEYLDFDKSYSWKIEKNGDNFYLKNEGTEWYVKGTAKELDSKYYVVSDKDNLANDKGQFLFEKVDGGYRIKSVEVNKYIMYGENQNYVTYTDDEAKANVWQIEEKPEYNNLKEYIIYSNSKDNTLYDDGGNEVGWLQKGKYVEFTDKFSWKIEANDTGFYLNNVGTSWYVKGEGKDLESKQYVVSDKKDGSEKGSYQLERVVNGYKIKSLTNGKYMMYGENGNYITFTDDVDKAMTWKIEIAPVYAKPEGSVTLWKSPSGNNFYRIPAITTANDGRLIAISDLRYGGTADLGNHQIDLLVKTSTDNGVTWSSETNLTEGLSTPTSGYGDAAIVADRESDKVLILAAAGSKAFWHSDKSVIGDRDNPLEVVKLTSDNGGESFSQPEEITSKIYDLNPNWTRLFVSSGRIMQSRYVKVGDYYRIYAALLVGSGKEVTKLGNFVIYSDDFGDTWNVLGGKDANVVPNGDEAKIEELPNGNVVISSRTETGRFINIFNYDESDSNFESGSWESAHQKVTLGNGTYACNGEILVVYARDIETKEYKHLVLQSLPALDGGSIRKGVSIFYKELNPNETTVSEYITGWNTNPYIVQELYSGYSTMSLQKDGKIAFFFEDRYVNWAYDEQFVSLDLEAITDGKYENAFTGIGSKKSPYIVETKEQLEAVNGIFSDEKVNWLYNIAPENPVLNATEITENSAIITWNAAEDNGLTQGYNIYNSENELLNETPITEERFEIQNLNPGTEYNYILKSVNKDGVESEATEVILSTLAIEEEGEETESKDLIDPSEETEPIDSAEGDKPESSTDIVGENKETESETSVDGKELTEEVGEENQGGSTGAAEETGKSNQVEPIDSAEGDKPESSTDIVDETKEKEEEKQLELIDSTEETGKSNQLEATDSAEGKELENLIDVAGKIKEVESETLVDEKAVDSENIKLDNIKIGENHKNNNYSIFDELLINTSDAKNVLGVIGLLLFSTSSLVGISLKKKK